MARQPRGGEARKARAPSDAAPRAAKVGPGAGGGRSTESPLAGLRHLAPAARARAIAEFARLGKEDRDLFERLASDLSPLPGGAGGDFLERMIENVAAWSPLPLGFAPNFLVNGTERVVPMAIEEASVVAAAANAAKMARPGGGFHASGGRALVIGQVELRDLASPLDAARTILANEAKVILHAEPQQSSLRVRGGGLQSLVVRLQRPGGGWASADSAGELPREATGDRVVVHLLVDTVDAMGANAVNARCEAAADLLAELTGARVGLRILTNAAPHRLVSARATFTADALGGPDVPGLIVEACEFAAADPFRAVTNNKGILNGIDAVMVATGNDWRAVEAAAHHHAARDGGYTSLSHCRLDPKGDLVAKLDVPIPVGVVGGATRAHPVARLCLAILGVKRSSDLAEVAASVGLASNVAALRALATEGIQAGHMRLHERLKRD